MKNTRTCPKCQSNEILMIPGNVGAYGSGNNILTGLTILKAVKVTRYLCERCGYTEEWIDREEDIIRLVQKYKKYQ